MSFQRWSHRLLLSSRCWCKPVTISLALISLAILVSSPMALASTVTLSSVQSAKVQHGTLDNGLEIYVYEDRSTPAVSMNLWYKVGSRDEPAELQGMAHLLEHMMFNGSKGIPKNVHAHLIDAVGGVLNAFTTNDVTVYWNKVPSNLLGAVLQLEADRMVNLEITPEKVKVEKEVVKEEYRMGLQNDPLGTTLDKLLATSLEGTPYAWTPAGSIPGIAAITADDLKKFYQDYYTPNNAVLVIAGDTDIQEATRLAEEAFGAIEPGPVPHREAVLLPKREAPRYVDIAMPLQLPSILGGYIIPGTTSDERMALEIASLILSAGQSSRLHQQLVREQGLAVAAGGFAQPFRDIGLFLNLAFHLDHQDPDTIIKAMRDEIEGMAANPPSEDELEKARNQVAASYAFSLDSLDGIANAIGYAVVLGRGIGEFEDAIDEYGSVTASDVQEVVAEYLRPENLTVFRVRPGEPPEGFLSSEEIKEDAADTKEQADITSDTLLQDLADQLGFSSPEAQIVELPAISHFQLENGLDVWLIERSHQPIASLQLFIPTGTYMEPVGKAGLADFTASMLRQGTKSRAADEMSMLIDVAGGSLGAWADDDGTTVYAQVMSKDLALAIDLMSDMVMEPAFPAQEIEMLRQQYLGAIYQQRDSASTLATQQAIAYLYGSDHPLGRPASISSIQSIEREDLVDFAREYYVPDGAMLVAAGDIDPIEFQILVATRFGGWSTDASTKPDKAEEVMVQRPLDRPRMLFIEKPGQTQVQIRMAQPGPSRHTSDWIAMDLYNYILGGGGFSSRLMKVIRSEMGETYGIGSGYRGGEYDGMFILYTFTENEKLYRTMRVIKSELEKLAAQGVTDEELRYAKANRIGSYALRFETLGGTASAITSGLRFRTLKEVQTYPLSVDAIDQFDISAAIDKHFHPGEFAIVLLGDPGVFGEAAKVAELYGIEHDGIERVNWLEIE